MKDDKRKKRNVSEKSFAARTQLSDLEPPKIYGGSRQRARVPAEPTRNQKRKRQNKRRRLKNSVRRGLLAACLLVVLLAVGAVLSLTVFFRTETIEAKGSGVYSQQEIADASGLAAGDNLFLLDSEEIEQRITRLLPYISSVEVERVLPETVRLNVTDASADYYIENTDGSCILLDSAFKVLENACAEIPAGAIKISNLTVSASEPGEKAVFEDADAAKRIALLAEAVRTTGMTQATEIYTQGVNSNYIIYMGRITFELGRCTDLENKITRGLASCEQLDSESPNIKGNLNLTVDKQSYFTAE